MWCTITKRSSLLAGAAVAVSLAVGGTGSALAQTPATAPPASEAGQAPSLQLKAPPPKKLTAKERRTVRKQSKHPRVTFRAMNSLECATAYDSYNGYTHTCAITILPSGNSVYTTHQWVWYWIGTSWQGPYESSRVGYL